MTLVSLAITLFCIILLVVSFSEPLAQRLGLPPPVIIGGIGAVAGTVAALFGFEKLGFGLDGYDRWLFGALALDAQSILLVFMPPLLFEMALGVNARRALEDGAAIAVLAVVAVVAATLLVGAALILNGHAVADIARDLAVSVETIRVHRRNIYEKLDVNSLAELFSLALQTIDAIRTGQTPPLA